MLIRKEALRQGLMESLRAVNKQIDEIERQARRLGTEPHIIRDENGGWALTPLLVAKVQCLHALTLLNDKEG